ncbi:MAG: histidine phosphatase family protein [Rhodospirillales bacterium]|nr:histidine phosphatase family protein [Rhodospirillales bacterium]
MILVRHGQSEFNVHYGASRCDPGIRDAPLTELGRAQARAVAAALAAAPLDRIVASPYTRTLETAEIISATLRLPITVEPLVGERAAFSCDIGSPPSLLAARWPHLSFEHLDDPWWPAHEESEESLALRCGRFRETIAGTADWHRVLVVTHWGVIRTLTGMPVKNCTALRWNPALPETPPEILHAPAE